jgi:hypothetical protein
VSEHNSHRRIYGIDYRKKNPKMFQSSNITAGSIGRTAKTIAIKMGGGNDTGEIEQKYC